MELERRAKEMIEVARAQHGSSAADAERVKAKLRARIAAEPLLIEPLSLERTRALPPRGSWLGKLLAVFAAGGGAGFAAGFWVAQTFGAAALPAAIAPVPGENGAPPPGVENSAERSPTPHGPAELSHAPSEADPAPAPNPLPEAHAAGDTLPRAESSLQRAPPRARPAPVEKVERKLSSLEAELEGLRRAQELLHKGDPAWALARLDELDRAGASSVLMDERRATRAMAECMLGKSESCVKTKPETKLTAEPRQTESGSSRHQSEQDGKTRKGK